MLTMKEFRRLPEEEKPEKYKELSDHDRFLWRISCPIVGHDIKPSELSEEKRKKLFATRKRLLKAGEITQEEYDNLSQD